MAKSSDAQTPESLFAHFLERVDLPHIAPEWRGQWQCDCMKWRGRVLTGAWSHWCDEWDGLPIDETTPEWPCACVPPDKQPPRLPDPQP